MGLKLDLSRTIYNADETPMMKEGGTPLTLGDALRAVYASTTQKDTGESKGKKGRLLKQLNGALRKGAAFDISTKDADFTVEQAGDSMQTVVFVQIDDLINERPTLGDNERVEGDGFKAGAEVPAEQTVPAS